MPTFQFVDEHLKNVKKAPKFGLIFLLGFASPLNKEKKNYFLTTSLYEKNLNSQVSVLFKAI